MLKDNNIGINKVISDIIDNLILFPQTDLSSSIMEKTKRDLFLHIQEDKPEPVITSIKIDPSLKPGTDFKTEYLVGESIDITNLKIVISKNDGTTETKNVVKNMVSGFDSSTPGNCNVTITYLTFTTSYTVSISEPAPPPEAVKKSVSKKNK